MKLVYIFLIQQKLSAKIVLITSYSLCSRYYSEGGIVYTAWRKCLVSSHVARRNSYFSCFLTYCFKRRMQNYCWHSIF